MKKIKIMLLSIILMSIPMLTLAATGHIDGCTNTGTDTSCCTKTYNITAKTGYQVTNVLVNGTSKGAVTSVTLSSIKGPQSIKVVSQYKGPYTITFNANGGSGTMKPIAVANGASVTLTANAFTKSGKAFKGWATSSSGSVAYNNSASVTPSSHLTLYAVWIDNPNVLTIKDSAGNVKATVSNTDNVKVTFNYAGVAQQGPYNIPMVTSHYILSSNISGQQTATYTITGTGPFMITWSLSDGITTTLIGSGQGTNTTGIAYIITSL